MRFDVITVGAGVVDVYIHSKQFRVSDSRTAPGHKDACVVLGEKIDVDAPVFGTGGGATNAAATFAHLGRKTACVCRVGRDRRADDVRADLHEHGVFTDFVVTDAREATGYSLLLTTAGGQRTAIVHRGASAHLTGKDVPHPLDAAWMYLTNLGGDLSRVLRIMDVAAASGTHIAWNPGAAELVHGERALAPLLKKTDALIMNREEAVALTRDSVHDTAGLLRRLAALCGGAVAMTDGARGAYAMLGDHAYRAHPTNAPVVNATGAGDAFGSAFVCGLMEWNGDIATSLRLALLNAESVIGKVGAKAGLLKRMPGTRKLGEIRVERYTV